MTDPLTPELDDTVTSPFAQDAATPAPPGSQTFGEVDTRMRAALTDSNPWDPHDDRKTDGAPTTDGAST